MTSAAPFVDPEDKKVVLLTIDPTIYGTGATATAELKVKGIKDTTGNKMADLTQAVTLNKDTVKPTLVKASVSAVDSKTVILELSEAVSKPDLSAVSLKVLNKSNLVDVSTTYSPTTDIAVLVNSKGETVVGLTSSKFVKFELKAALPAGTYEVTIPKDGIVDPAGNKTNVETFTLTTTGLGDSVKPTATATATVTGGQNVITVTYDEDVNLADATNRANYVLNGTALPTGTQFENISTTATETKKFKIILPADSVNADVATAPLLINNVKDKAGNVINPTTLTVAIADTKKPTLVKAEATAATTVELTFSEPVAMGAAGTIKIGGVTFTVGTGTASVLGNKVTLTTSPVAGIDLTKAAFTIDAAAIIDLAATPNTIDAIAATDYIYVADKFVDTTGASVATTETGTTKDITSVSVNITAPTNASVDTIVAYDVYIANDIGAGYFTTVSNVEKNLTKLVTLGANKAGAAQALPLTAGNKLSDGTSVSALNGKVTTYIIAIDDKGNKALIKQDASGLQLT